MAKLPTQQTTRVRTPRTRKPAAATEAGAKAGTKADTKTGTQAVEKAAPEKAAPEKAAPEKAAPEKAAEAGSTISTEAAPSVTFSETVGIDERSAEKMVRLAEQVQEGLAAAGVAYPDAVRRRDAVTARGRAARRAAPVQTSNYLGDLPESLSKLAVRAGDVRLVRRISRSVVEMDIETARRLSLVP